MTTFSELQTEVTASEYLTQLLATLSAAGFPVTAWQSGNAGRTLAQADAAALADLRAVIAEIANGGYLDEAEGEWLTLLAAGVFDLDRRPAEYTTGDVTLTCSASAGPYNVTAGALTVSDGERRWTSTNTTTVVVPSGGSVSITVRAESPGTEYNTAWVDIDTIVTPALAGVTASPGSIATNGAPEETDAALRARCRTRWATLGRGANTDAYEYWALNGHDYEGQVTRVAVYPGAGDGTVTVYLADADGPVSGGVVGVVQDWLELNLPATDEITVASASAGTIIVAITATVPSAYNTTAVRAAAAAAVAAYINGLAIGAEVDMERISAAILAAAPQIIDLDLTAPINDIPLAGYEVAVADTAGVSLAGNWTSVG